MMSSAEIQPFLAALGMRIKQLRKVNGLTQMDLASKVELDIRQVQRIEAGEINTSIGNIYILAQGFGISLNELLDFSFEEGENE